MELDKSEIKKVVTECINESFADMSKNMGYKKIVYDNEVNKEKETPLPK